MILQLKSQKLPSNIKRLKRAKVRGLHKKILGINKKNKAGKENSQNPKILRTAFKNNRDTRFSFVDEYKNRIGFPDCCLLKIDQNLILAIFFTCL